MNKDSKVFVAGARGLVGSAICRALAERAFVRVLAPSRSALDLRDRAAVERFFAAERPDFVFMAAAKVGGIVANDSFPADFIRDNLEIVVDLAQYRSSKILELTIIALIAFEVAFALVEKLILKR